MSEIQNLDLEKTLRAKEAELESMLSGDMDAETFEKARGLRDEIRSIRRQILAADMAADDELPSGVGAGEPAAKAQVLGYSGEASAVDRKTVSEASTNRYKDDFVRYLKSGGEFKTKALVEGRDSEGGFLAPPEFVAELIRRRPAPTRLRARVREIPTSSSVLQLPAIIYDEADADIYTSPIRVKFVGETVASGEAAVDKPKFGTKEIRVGTWMMELPITNDLLEDSAVDLVQYVVDEFRTAVNLLIDDQILNGTGVGGRPVGLLQNPGEAGFPGVKLSGTAGDIDADQVRSIPFAVAEQYAENGVFVMNRRVTGDKISKFKSSDGTYLFAFGMADSRLAAPVPETLVGYPIVWSAFMPNPAATTYPILFGDLSGYRLAMRSDLSIEVTRELGLRENLRYVVARLRFGGAPFEPWAMVLGKANNA